jgi:hypothetical protein
MSHSGFICKEMLFNDPELGVNLYTNLKLFIKCPKRSRFCYDSGRN